MKEKKTMVNVQFRYVFLSFAVCILIFHVVSCSTVPPLVTPSQVQEVPWQGLEKKEIPTRIMGNAAMSANQLARFLVDNNPAMTLFDVQRLASMYIKEAMIEGVNADIAFVQMCLETGFLKFGGLVSADMHNYCGLGAIGPDQPGLRFETAELGVRAHIQHLKAYGSADVLVQDLVDPRYKYVVPKGKAPTFYELAGTWASDREYGVKIETLLQRLYNS